MLSKNEIKDIQSLSHKKHREERNLFIAEGPKIVGELLEAVPSLVENVYATQPFYDAYKANAKVKEVSAIELEKISQLQTPNGVLAVVRKFPVNVPTEKGFFMYLDTIQDPGNLGTIIRIADWFGITHIGCSAGCADPYNPKVIQSTMGSILRVHLFADEEGSWLQQQKQDTYVAALDGTPLQNFQKVDAGVLVIGNESKGVRPEIMKMATHKIRIPGKGGAESLNAAVAAGIIVSHLLN